MLEDEGAERLMAPEAGDGGDGGGGGGLGGEEGEGGELEDTARERGCSHRWTSV